MSHTIQLTLKDIKLQLSVCDNLLDRLKQIQQVDKVMKNSMNNNVDSLIHTINKYKDKFTNTSTFEVSKYTNLISNLTSAEKQVANLFTFAKDFISNSLIDKLNEQDFNFVETFKKFGVLTNEVVEYLQENNIPITNENFLKYKDNVEQTKLTDQKIKQYVNNAFDMIDKSAISDEVKVELKKEIRNINSLTQIKDLSAIILSKENDTNKVKNLSKKVIDLLKKQGFQPYGKMIWEYDQNNANIVAKFSMQNESNNIVQMIVDSSEHLKYKLGNYKGHACIKTTEKLIRDLKSTGIDVAHQVIKRDYEDGVQYMYMKNEGEK